MARKSRVNKSTEKIAASVACWNGGIYGRLSVEDGDDLEQNSIGNQKKISLHFLETHSDINLVDSYSDNGYTGMNFERPDFIRMFHDIQSGKINCVIVKDISRLGRHFIMTSDFVERIFPEMGVRLICINDDYDSNDKQADAASLTLPLKMVMNDYYVKDISRKIRSAISAKMDSGEFLPSVGSIPYGYLRDAENNTFKVDGETAPVVRKIYDMRAAGKSFNSICRELNADGIPSPGKIRYLRGLTKDQRHKDALWIRGTVRKITSDKVYLGYRIHGKVKREKIGMNKNRCPENEWKFIENAHEAIINREHFDAVQSVNMQELEKRAEFTQRNGVENDYRDLFRGLVFCAECKSTMSAAKGCARIGAKTSSRVFYDCNSYKDSGHTKCSSHYIRQEDIYNHVKVLLDQQIRMAVDIEKLIADIQNRPQVMNYTVNASEKYAALVHKRKSLEVKMEQLLIDLTERLIDKNEYDYMRERYNRDLDLLLKAEEKAAIEKDSLRFVVASTEQWLQAIRQYRILPEINRDIVELLIRRIDVYADRHIKITLNYSDPYKPIEQFLDTVEEVRHVG